MGSPEIRMSYTDIRRSALETPTPLVELPCGSRSTRRMTRPSAARAADRLTAVVVFPTPPFWLTIANVFPVGCDSMFIQMLYGCDDEGPSRNRAPVLYPSPKSSIK